MRVEHLASISAVLGGFAVTFLSVVLTHEDPRRRVGVLLGVTMAAAATYFIVALGWSLSAATELPKSLQRPLSLLFIAATGLLFVVLGLVGWLRSRALGMVTSALAVVSTCGAWLVLRSFIR